MQHPRSIFVISTAHFGKALLMLPAIAALRRNFPQTFIQAAVATGIGELLARQALVDEVIDLGTISAAEQNLGGAMKRLFKLLAKTRANDTDLILDFSPRLETQIISRFRGQVRYVTPSRFSRLLDLFLKRRGFQSEDHFAECTNVLRQIGITNIEENFVFNLPNDESLKFEDKIFRKASRSGVPIVVLYSSQAGASREWGIAKFADLAHRLINNFQVRIVAIDEPDGNRFTKAIKAQLPPNAGIVAAPSAGEFIAALARASVVITDERGVAKTAADLDSPVIEIADSDSPYAHGKSYRVIESSSRFRVSVEEVMEAAYEMIQTGRTASVLKR